MSKLGDKLVEIEEQDPKPSLGEPIRCGCKSKTCSTYVRVETVGTYIALYTKHAGQTPNSSGEYNILLDSNAALDLAIILQEAVSDARAEGGKK